MVAERYDVNGWKYERDPFDGIRLVKDYGPHYATITKNATPEVFGKFHWTIWNTPTGNHITGGNADSVPAAQDAADAHPT
ncbi:hypothetical protein [Nocardia wallacei]|uniref:hypothetical protein n=1 Tax=Nocardia wallacei TaxID=480035 RepID=UPI002458E518|nr:hypothetical protein [Nocardia wallacei]